MLRWLFIGLLLANVTILMWGLWHRTGDQTGIPRRDDYRAGKMRLLDDPEVVKRKRLPGSQPAVGKLKEVNLVGRCFRIGPFASSKSINKATRQLKQLGVTARLRRERVRVTSYRIYLPPQKTKAAARRLQRRLYYRGFRDTYILSEPGLKYAVSIGVYTRKKNAQKVIKRLQRKGFRPRQQVDALRRRVSWLDVQTTKLTLDTLIKRPWGGPDVRVRQMSQCNRR